MGDPGRRSMPAAVPDRAQSPELTAPLSNRQTPKEKLALRECCSAVYHASTL